MKQSPPPYRIGTNKPARQLRTEVLWAAALLLSACTIPHSRQALWTHPSPTPSPQATFVTEEDAGLSILGLVQITEPDHYAVLLERARRRYRCARFSHAQLDFYTDHWAVVAFPIARITLICDPAGPPPKSPSASNPRQ